MAFTLNTHVFHAAIFQLATIYASQGGGTQLTIPSGRWLTGSFNLTSHFTLFLQKGAVLLASQFPRIFYIFKDISRQKSRQTIQDLNMSLGKSISNLDSSKLVKIGNKQTTMLKFGSVTRISKKPRTTHDASNATFEDISNDDIEVEGELFDSVLKKNERRLLWQDVWLQKFKWLIYDNEKNIQDWPVIDPLPSYGRGRERPGGRYISFIHGQNLVDVVITGENGTIDGQGVAWWDRWYKRTLLYTRGHLVEFVSSQKVVIANVVLQNSPFWTVHPVYCDHVIVKGVSILAPHSAPNTDGVDPDSSTNVCIEDCYISNGDDLVALKSGWDEYGIAVGRPSAGIIVRRLTGTTPFSGISIGSEMSGGIKNVFVKDVNIFNTGTGIRIKTAPGRGGYVENVTMVNITMSKMVKAIDITEDAGEHPDDNFDPNAVPLVRGLTFDNIVGQDISSAGRFLGLKRSPIRDVCMSRVSLILSAPGTWSCTYVEGEAAVVSPAVCSSFRSSRIGVCS